MKKIILILAVTLLSALPAHADGLSDLDRRVTTLEKSQRGLIGDKERLEIAIRALQKRPAVSTVSQSVSAPEPVSTPAPVTDASIEPDDGASWTVYNDNPTQTWRAKRMPQGRTSGRLTAIIEWPGNLNRETSWLAQISSAHEALFTIVIGGRSLRTDTQHHIDQPGYKHLIGRSNGVPGPGVYKFVWQWSARSFDLLVYDEAGKQVLRQSRSIAVPVSAPTHVAVGRQARPGRYPNVGNVIVRAVRLSFF